MEAVIEAQVNVHVLTLWHPFLLLVLPRPHQYISWWGGGHKIYTPGIRLDQPKGSLPPSPAGEKRERERKRENKEIEKLIE